MAMVRSSLRVALAALLGSGILFAGLPSCDGTLAGIGPTPREPETPLPSASAQVGAGNPLEQAEATTEPGGEPVPDTIAAQHLLVSYDGARGDIKSAHRSRNEARDRAYEALQRIQAGTDFDQVVVLYTDEPGGAARRGDLGRFTRDKMVKPFSDAAFKLQVGQVSSVVETPFGFHVIRRTE